MENKRTGWADLLRCLACLAVVILHAVGGRQGAVAMDSKRFLFLNGLNSAMRWCVPVFVMLSGAFLLDPRREMDAKKWLGYVKRIALVTLVWGFGYCLYDARAAHFGLELFLEALIRFVNARLYYHLWYLPILLGLYILLPLLRGLVAGCSRRGLWYAVGLWGLTCSVMETVLAFTGLGVQSAWYYALNLHKVTGYWGYMVLGYLLRTCEIKPWREKLLYALGALGLAATFLGTQRLSEKAGTLELRFYSYFAPNVVITAAALFLLARRLDLGKGGVWGRLAPYTFGVYLIHPFCLELLGRLGQRALTYVPGWLTPAEILVVTVLGAALALGLCWVVRKIPKLGKAIT